MNSQMMRVHAALSAASLIYGCFYVAVKILFKHVSPEELLLLRFLLTAILVTGIDQFVLKNPPPQRKDLPAIAGLGLTGVFLVQILLMIGLSLTTAFHSALIMATIPIFTLFISVIKGQERFQAQKLIGVFTAFIGVTVLLLFSPSPNVTLPPNYLIGDLIILVNAFAFAWFLVGSQRILNHYRAFSYMAYCYIISAALFVVCYFGKNKILHGHFGLGFLNHIGWEQWALIAYVVIFASIGSYTLNNFALKRTSPSVVSIYIFIQPVISAVTAYYLLGERFTIGMAVAAFLTFTGVLCTTSVNDSQPLPMGFVDREPYPFELEEREKKAK